MKIRSIKIILSIVCIILGYSCDLLLKAENYEIVEKTTEVYKVSYFPNNATSGKVPVDNTSYETGDVITILDYGTLKKNGCTFWGWAKDPSDSYPKYKIDDKLYAYSQNLDLYAIWIEYDTYSVKYDANGADIGEVPFDKNNYTDSEYAIVKDQGELKKSGYSFIGWSVAKDKLADRYSPSQKLRVRKNITLYAQWTKEPVFEVLYHNNEDAKGMVPKSNRTYTTGSEAIILDNTVLKKYGYILSEWNTKSDSTGSSYAVDEKITIGKENLNLYPIWVENDPGLFLSFFSLGENSYSFVSSYNSNSKNVLVPSKYKGYKVKEIFQKAFYKETKLESIIIPDTVENIKSDAFYDCISLSSVSLSNNLKKIYQNAFFNCLSLSTINLSNSLTEIHSSAFDGCEGLTEIIIPNNVKNISSGAFANCKSLTSMIIPDKVNYIASFLFENCINLKLISLPDGITSIDRKAFSNCKSLETITIPDSVTKIGNGVFSSCTSLTSIILPNSLSHIEYGVFSNCEKLESITIPDGVIAIGGGAFEKCNSLSSVIIPNGVKVIDFSLFKDCTNLTSVSLPDGIDLIKNKAFYNCKKLEDLVIPDSVTEIKAEAFYGCESLISLNIPNGVVIINNWAFSYCSSLKTLTLPESIEKLGYGVFSNSGITELIFEGKNPPAVDSEFLKDSLIKKIIVPKGALDNYKEFNQYNVLIDESSI